MKNRDLASLALSSARLINLQFKQHFYTSPLIYGMDGLSAERIVELFEKDVGSRKRLAELLVAEPDVRLAIINALIRDVATREDIEDLRKETREDIERLKAELKSYIDEKVNSINMRVSDLYGVVKASLVAIVVTLASTILVPLMLRIVFRA
jgi:hypothetical protein